MSLFSIPVPEFSLVAALSNHTMALASTSFLYDLVVCQHFIANKICSIFFSAFSTALGLIYSVVVAGNVKLSAEQRPDRWLLPFP